MRSFVLIAVLAGCSGVVFAQAAPVKMGLWEKKMTMDTGTGTPRQLVSKSCITPESWQEMVGNVTRQHEGCKIQTTKTGKGYTYDGTCTIDVGTGMVAAIASTRTVAMTGRLSKIACLRPTNR